MSSGLAFQPVNTPATFMGGKIYSYRRNWLSLSGDQLIFDIVYGNVIDLESCPIQDGFPRPLTFSLTDKLALDAAMREFIACRIVEKCCALESDYAFYSNIFPVIKPDGSARIILNLKELNKCIAFSHFKMDTIRDVLNLIFPSCFFMTVDFKHAYYSVYVTPNQRKWLRFIWNNEHYQFTSLPQGLTSAPRLFTKLLKPVFTHLRKLGMLVSCYIDDCIFIAASQEDLLQNVTYALRLFDSLGLTVNMSKSVLVPVQVIHFLGVILDSVTMTITLPAEKVAKIKTLGATLLRRDVSSIQDLASFIGQVVFAGIAVPQAPLRYKYLEIVRNMALIRSKGNYKATVCLDAHATDLIAWWVNHLHLQRQSLCSSFPDFELQTDASLSGWGATLGLAVTSGHWDHVELDHINCLELKAVLLGLKALCKDFRDVHVRLRSDNMTTIACIDRCGSTKISLLDIVAQIFEWASMRNITISAEYIKGCDNVVADRESRVKNFDSEWQLDPLVFRKLCRLFFLPDSDLFATRINTQLSRFVSWKPDPDACHTNAFTLSWTKGLNYAFPPFSIIGRVLKKIQEDKATLLVVLPLWPTQTWFPTALQLLVAEPVLLPRECVFLPQSPALVHPMADKLRLAAMVLSGDLLKVREFHLKLRSFSLDHGEMAQNNNMGLISRDGCHFVSRGVLIHFTHL